MITQQYIGEHLDLDQSSISRLCSDLGIDWRTTSIDAIRIAYIRRLREQAAGRATAGDLDLANERAALARAQRVRIEMQNFVTRKELAPVALLSQIIAKTATKISGQLEAIPGAVRRRCPELGANIIGMIAEEIAKIRNTVAQMKLEDLDRPFDQFDPDDEAELIDGTGDEEPT